jgi:hypothetical protein
MPQKVNFSQSLRNPVRSRRDLSEANETNEVKQPAFIDNIVPPGGGRFDIPRHRNAPKPKDDEEAPVEDLSGILRNPARPTIDMRDLIRNEQERSPCAAYGCDNPRIINPKTDKAETLCKVHCDRIRDTCALMGGEADGTCKIPMCITPAAEKAFLCKFHTKQHNTDCATFMDEKPKEETKLPAITNIVRTNYDDKRTRNRRRRR